MKTKEFQWAPLVPELVCSDLVESKGFYIGIVGARLEYERPGFAYLSIGNAQIMLEQEPSEWVTGGLEAPYGRGVNFQIEVDNVEKLAARLSDAAVPLFRELRDEWYSANGIEHGQREFLVQDPDGYLLRFNSVIGNRIAGEAT